MRSSCSVRMEAWCGYPSPRQRWSVLFAISTAGETWRNDWQKHRAFATRPKTAGLWVRFRFRDGDRLEGILPNNLLQIEPAGFSAIPAGPSYQNQRVFVPRLALSGVEVLGTIGNSARRRPAKKTDDDSQLKMF